MYLNGSVNFTPSASGVTSYTHTENSSKTNTVTSYAVNSANLIDYLTKREYMFRQLNLVKGNTVYVPKALTASPNNPLVKLFKSSYNFNDPINLSSELIRDMSAQSLSMVDVKDNSKLRKVLSNPSTNPLTAVEALFSNYTKQLNQLVTDSTHEFNSSYS
jgi:hypothetical protein